MTAADWQLMRDVRLAALRDAPQEFWSGYAEEAGMTEADWQRRIASGGNFLGYAPELGHDAPVGIVAGVADEAGTAQLVSMWVSPAARGHGVGAALVRAVADWAWANGHPVVHLWVTETNAAARSLYEGCGFRDSGERQSRPSYPALTDMGMLLRR